MSTYGLLGKNISYSFSKPYFENFFNENNLPHQYLNFDIEEIHLFPEVVLKNPDLRGINITIPYKEKVIHFIDDVNKIAEEIGAVNCIKIDNNQKLTGYNTDYYGFAKSLKKHLLHHKKALIFGSGGASKAVAYALKELKIDYQIVSRKDSEHSIAYQNINPQLLVDYQILINCTPLGSAHQPQGMPPLPYEALSKDHLLFDLTYNPPLTPFLEKGKQNGATIINGLEMLTYQAQKSWEIWSLSEKII